MTQADASANGGGPGAEITRTGDPDYDFGGACFDLEKAEDREIVRFILSQALFGEATGVYCGKSLYSAGSLEAAPGSAGGVVAAGFPQAKSAGRRVKRTQRVAFMSAPATIAPPTFEGSDPRGAARGRLAGRWSGSGKLRANAR